MQFSVGRVDDAASLTGLNMPANVVVECTVRIKKVGRLLPKSMGEGSYEGTLGIAFLDGG